MFSNQSNITWYLVHLDIEPMFKQSRNMVRAMVEKVVVCVCARARLTVRARVSSAEWGKKWWWGHQTQQILLHSRNGMTCNVGYYFKGDASQPMLCGWHAFYLMESLYMMGLSLLWQINKYTIIICRYNHNSDVPRFNKRDMNNNNNPGL